jgi:hypothetical protein
MKVIYMQQTIMLMSQKDPKGTQALISSGTIKQDEKDKPYLVTYDEQDRD